MKSLALLAILCLTGCTSGLLYSNKRTPLTRNLRGTPLGTKIGEMSVKELREIFTGVDLRAQWSSNAIGDIAQQFGMKEIYFADINTLSILAGIWKEETVRVMGD